MIYEFPEVTAPIRQGDIFQGLPRVELSLAEMTVLRKENELEAVPWEAIRQDPEPMAAIVGLRSVWAIVITQDCDTIRVPDVSLCEIRRFPEVVKVNLPNTAKKWAELIRTQATANLKWFYLPADPNVGFEDRMAVDFLATLRVPRQDLETMRHLRRGRLNPTADEHFRERLAEFFRRYPYDEWYPFSKEEFDAYKAGHPQEASIILPYHHQL